MGFLEKIYHVSPIPIQVLMLNIKAAELYLERYGRKFDKVWDEFKQIESSASSDITTYQTERMQQLIRHAYETVPYYRDLFVEHKLEPADIKTLTDLAKIPVLTKQTIKDNFNRLVSSSANQRKLRHGHTSGTTGSPLNLLYDIQTCVVHHVADWRQKEWAGLKRGEAYASLQGRVICPSNQQEPPFWRKNYVNNQLFLSSFHLKKECLPHYFDELSRRNIKFIEGYPSTIYTLASYLKSTGQSFPMSAVLTSSETLFEFQRETIEAAFQCKIFDFFGMAERVVFATECDKHGGHHLNQDYGITEFVDPKGHAVPPGASGKIVATSLHNFAFPMIRYQTNDSCSLKPETCSCGCAFPLMDDVATKDEAIVTLPDGRWISPSVLTHPFKPMENVTESQIIQEDLLYIRILVVKNEKYGNADEAQLLQSFRDRLGEEIEIVIEYPDTIPRTKSGKYKWVISKVKPEFG